MKRSLSPCAHHGAWKTRVSSAALAALGRGRVTALRNLRPRAPLFVACCSRFEFGLQAALGHAEGMQASEVRLKRRLCWLRLSGGAEVTLMLVAPKFKPSK